MKRKHGLLKKAAELSILCGLKVSLVFSDIQPHTFHVFSNDCAHKVDYEAFLRENFIKEQSTFHEYSIFDYPFETVGDQDSKVVVGPVYERQELNELLSRPHLSDKKDNNLKKREPAKASTKAGTSIKTSSQVPIVLTFDATDKNKSKTLVSVPEPKLLQAPCLPELSTYKYKFLGFEAIPAEHKVATEGFISDLDTKLSVHLEDVDKKGQADEETVLMLMARCFLLKFFGFSNGEKGQDHITELLRSLVDVESMVNCVHILKELVMANDGLLQKLKQFNNILINALIKPDSFDNSLLVSLRGGKSIEPVVSFYLRSLLQQVRLLDSMNSGEKTAIGDIGSFITFENYDYVDKIVAAVFNIIASQRGKAGLTCTPIKKPVFKIKSEISVPEATAYKETKALNIFGASQEKFMERDRRSSLP